MVTLTWLDAVGFLAAALTVVTFAQSSMILMRIFAISANLCFVAYGAFGPYPPVLALHVALLPINVSRLLLVLRARRGPEGPVDRTSAGTHLTSVTGTAKQAA